MEITSLSAMLPGLQGLMTGSHHSRKLGSSRTASHSSLSPQATGVGWRERMSVIGFNQKSEEKLHLPGVMLCLGHSVSVIGPHRGQRSRPFWHQGPRPWLGAVGMV